MEATNAITRAKGSVVHPCAVIWAYIKHKVARVNSGTSNQKALVPRPFAPECVLVSQTRNSVVAAWFRAPQKIVHAPPHLLLRTEVVKKKTIVSILILPFLPPPGVLRICVPRREYLFPENPAPDVGLLEGELSLPVSQDGGTFSPAEAGVVLLYLPRDVLLVELPAVGLLLPGPAVGHAALVEELAGAARLPTLDHGIEEKLVLVDRDVRVPALREVDSVRGRAG